MIVGGEDPVCVGVSDVVGDAYEVGYLFRRMWKAGCWFEVVELFEKLELERKLVRGVAV